MIKVGMYVSDNSIALAAIQQKTVVWNVLASTSPETFADACRELLAQMPALGWPTPRAFVAFGPGLGIYKTVRNLPQTRDTKLVQRIISTTPHRFFLGSAGEWLTTAVQVDEPGIAIVGGLRAHEAGVVRNALADVGIRRCCFTPSEAVPTLGEESLEAPEIATATSVAIAGKSICLFYEPKPLPRDRRRSLVVVGGALGVLLSMTAIVPPLLASRSAERARQTISSLARTRSSALALRQELETVTGEIDLVARFERQRTSKGLLIAALNDALPNGAAIVSIKVDSSGTTMVALAPHAVDLVQAIESIPGISKIEIVGPVARELAGVVEVERVTIRFKGATGEADARVPLVTDTAEQER